MPDQKEPIDPPVKKGKKKEEPKKPLQGTERPTLTDDMEGKFADGSFTGQPATYQLQEVVVEGKRKRTWKDRLKSIGKGIVVGLVVVAAVAVVVATGGAALAAAGVTLTVSASVTTTLTVAGGAFTAYNTVQSLRQKDIWNNDISQEEADYNLGFGISGIAAGPASRIGGRFINNAASRFFNSGIAGTADDLAAVTDDLAAVTVGSEEAASNGSSVYRHYTNEAGYNAIMESGELLPSIGAKNARYGSGQYFTDLTGDMTAGQVSRRLFGVPWNTRKLSHFIDVDVRSLNVINNGPHNFLVPNTTSLPLNGRIINHGPSIFTPKQ